LGIKKWLEKKQTTSRQDIQEVLQLLPVTKNIVLRSWRASGSHKGFKRIILCTKLILIKSLSADKKKICILTGVIQTGKTTSLLNWAQNKNNIFGIVTPVIEGKRFFLDTHTNKKFEMEADGNKEEALSVGKYFFSKQAFEKANSIIRANMNKPGWLVIDEIGPLELKGEGFAQVLKEIVENQNGEQTLLLVVRESILEEVKKSFQLTEAIVIRNISELAE
jgi:nucleoside-triphosphatase THEP1